MATAVDWVACPGGACASCGTSPGGRGPGHEEGAAAPQTPALLRFWLYPSNSDCARARVCAFSLMQNAGQLSAGAAVSTWADGRWLAGVRARAAGACGVTQCSCGVLSSSIASFRSSSSRDGPCPLLAAQPPQLRERWCAVAAEGGRPSPLLRAPRACCRLSVTAELQPHDARDRLPACNGSYTSLVGSGKSLLSEVVEPRLVHAAFVSLGGVVRWRRCFRHHGGQSFPFR